MIYAYNQMSPTVVELSKLCFVPEPFMAPTSFMKTIDGRNFSCTDTNEFTCIGDVCQLFATAIDLENVYDKVSKVDAKVREIFPLFTGLGFFNPLTQEQVNTVISVISNKKQVDPQVSKVFDLHQKAIEQLWTCLEDPGAYNDQAKHLSTLKVLHSNQNVNKYVGALEIMKINTDKVKQMEWFESSSMHLRKALGALVILSAAAIAFVVTSRTKA